MSRFARICVAIEFLVLVVWPLTARGSASLQLSDTSPARGSLLTFKLPDKSCHPEAFLQSEKIPIYRNQTFVFGLVGIGLDEDVETKILRIQSGDCPEKSIYPIERTINVRSGQYSVERLTVEDTGKVELSPKVLRRHRRESKKMKKTLSRRTPVPYWTLDFHPPVEGSRFTENRNFGARRIFNGHPRNPHGGEDYPAPVGGPVSSINHGRVALTGEYFLSGKSVLIDHGRGLFSMYFHLSTIGVKEDEFVRKGQLIGKAGSTGRATGPHLHLEIHLRGDTINPNDFFSRPLRFLRE